MATPCFARRFILLASSFIILLYANAQPASWQPRGIGGGGSMFFPTINPANDNEFFITCDMSQLFHSTDFGNSYTQIPFTKLQTGNVSTYEFTKDNNIAYCIANTGNNNFGVVTTDGGNNWVPLPGNPDNTEEVFALKADYDNPGRSILNYYGDLYISRDTAKTYTLIKRAANAGAGITLAGVFFDNDNIYIGTNEGIFYSANGGVSFALLTTTGMPTTEAIFSFAGAKAGGTTRFFCITAAIGDIFNGIAPFDYFELAKGVYSLDAGINVWTPKMNGITISNDFVMYVGMARNDINTVYLGGSDRSTNGNMVLKTTNAGSNWNKVFLTANNQNIRTGWSGQGGDRGWSYGEACFGITVAPNNSNKVLFGDFGFVHTTADGGANWKQAYINSTNEHPAGAPTPPKQYYQSIGLENTSCWQIHWQDANNMFACFSDINGLRSTNGGISWSFDFTGHTINTMYRIAKHTTANTMFAATSGVHDMYQSTRLRDNILDVNDPGGRIIYSTNNGAAWQLLHQFNHPVFWVATDPNNQNRMYASVIHYGSGTGQGGIWKTDDLNNLAGSTWVKLPNPPRTEGHPASIVVLNDGKAVCTFSGRRTAAGAFTTSSGVFIYDPLANSWTDVSHPDMFYWTKDIIIDPTDPLQNTWYVCVFSGFGGAPNGLGGLFRTTNRGVSWTKLTGTQFDRVTSITFNPTISNQAYLTTEVQGLWISNNMNAATPTWSLVNNYPFRQPERVFFNPFNQAEIWVSSFGNGMRLGVQSGPLPVKLISFTGHRYGSFIQLQWATTGEENGDVFDLERSTDGLNFERIYTIPGKGTSGSYQQSDSSTAPVVYYRLKVKSASGNYFYSRVLVFQNKFDTRNNIKLLRNPVSDQILLSAEMQQSDNLLVVLTDLSGKQILQQRITVPVGSNQMAIALPANCTNGIYVLQLSGKHVEKRMRVMVGR